MFDEQKEKRLKKILDAHEGYITDLVDLIADKEPSLFFYLLGVHYSKLLCDFPDSAYLKREIGWRKKMHPVIQKLVPLFMKQAQMIENRRELKGCTGADTEIILPEEPVIWIANHAFMDDAAASISVIKRHAYILFGSLPQFYNTFDGISAYLNGVVMVNRKVKASSGTTVERCVKVMQQNTDLLIFPEGVWNKTPEKLLLDFWPGVYRISKATGAKVVPIVHYSKNPIYGAPHNEIHTVVDDPVRIDDLSEKDALSYLREIMGTWYYLMMEKYGQSTRNEELEGFTDSNAAWEHQLAKRIEVVERYDMEIERSADYCSREIVMPMQVWEAISQIKHVTAENVSCIAYASKHMDLAEERDFQHRF